MKKARLHELLAVESDLKGNFDKINQETLVTFTKKTDHFRGHVRSLEMREEDRKFEEDAAFEKKDVATTVLRKLMYAAGPAVKYFDALLQKEATNQTATADLTIDGVVIAADLPATFLLGLESRLKGVRTYYQEIPTHDPATTWVADEAMGPGIFRADLDDVRDKAEKKTEYITVAPATEAHAAQVAKEMNTLVVGKFTTKKWSGMISPAEKSDVLARVDALIRAVKRARQRANQAEVVKTTVGNKLFEFILEGTL
jgi:hypothetical protein